MKEYLGLGKNGQLTLPPSICRVARLKEGDLLKVVVEEDGSIHLITLSAEERKLVERSQMKDIHPPIKKARGMLKGINTDNIHEETDGER